MFCVSLYEVPHRLMAHNAVTTTEAMTSVLLSHGEAFSFYRWVRKESSVAVSQASESWLWESHVHEHVAVELSGSQASVVTGLVWVRARRGEDSRPSDVHVCMYKACDSKGQGRWECEGDPRVRSMMTGRRQMSLRDGFSCVKDLNGALREESMKDRSPLCSPNREWLEKGWAW